MYKIILLFILLFTLNAGWSNPVAPEYPRINELIWDNNGGWNMEIAYDYYDTAYPYFDSIVLFSSSFRYKISLPASHEHWNFYILNQTITGDTFDIRQSGDSLSLVTYGYYINEIKVSLVFGNYNNAAIATPESGKSIALFEGIKEIYGIDDSPTLGYENDMQGLCGTIKGKIYDFNGNLVKRSGWFAFDTDFKIGSDSTYIATMVNGTKTLSKIGFCSDLWEVYYGSDDWYTINPIELNIESDQVYEDINITITDPAFVSIKKQEQTTAYKIFPNPTSNRFTVKRLFNTPTQCVILDLKGTEVARYVLAENSTEQTIQLPESIMSGIYMLNLIENNQLVYSEKMIINSFK
jgi:hypothetical protein